MSLSAPTTPRPRGDRFALAGWRIQHGEARFGFDCSRYGRFEERVWFPGLPLPDAPDDGTGRLLDLLHVALGVSTYKAAAAHRIELPALTPAGQAMAQALYTEGLAEFFVREGLAYPPGTEMAFADTREPRAIAPAEGPSLVAFGGGKDSYVAKDLVEAAGERTTLCSVVMAEPVRDALIATAPPDEPPIILWRALDPRLPKLDGAFGGHVPITAINTLVLSLYARLAGYGQVVFANERSADEPTLASGGVEANHQYSKTTAFENLIAQAVAETGPGAPAVFSVLRPYAEAWIARRFAALAAAPGGPLTRFTSCNRNFRLAGHAARRWCGACAKCAFTSLMTGPWMTRGDHLAAFGADFFEAPALRPYQEALLGLTEVKPWDCVGTIDEARGALLALARGEVWPGSSAVQTLLPRVLAVASEAEVDRAWTQALTPWPTGGRADAYLPDESASS